MTELSSLQIRFNAPLILGFALVSLAALVLDRLTRGAANRRLFSVYRLQKGSRSIAYITIIDILLK